MKKRDTIILYILLIAAFFSLGTVFVAADNYDKYGIYINEKKLDQNINVKSHEGFEYLPLDQMKIHLDFTLKEDKTKDTLMIITSSKTIRIINKNTYMIDGGQAVPLDVPIKLLDGSIYMPVMYINDLFGYKVEIMDDVKCIRIKTPSNTTPVGKLVDVELNKLIPVSKADSSIYPRVAYLTFDDGLDSKITPMILDILSSEDVKATFFIVGNTVEKNKSLLKRMIEEGHSIGNHSYTHKKEYVYGSAAGLENEINKTNAALYNAAGVITNLFRPPYGGTYIKREDFRPVLNAYRTILWNVDSMDSKSKTISSAEILSNVISQVKNKKSAVIIMHDSGTHIETVKALPAIIKYLKDNGFTILPIKEDTSIYYQY